MATTQEKLTLLANTKEAIKNAIIAQGVTVEDTDTFASYADKIASIQGGSDTLADMLDNSTYATRLNYLFYYRCVTNEALKSVENTCKTRTITTIERIFSNSKFLDITKFEDLLFKGIELATGANYAFYNVTLPQVVEVLNLIFPNVRDAQSMFAGCTGLTNVSINLSNATNISSIFSGCDSLKKIALTTSDSLTTVGSSAFSGINGKLEELTGLNITNVKSVDIICPTLTRLVVEGSKEDITLVDEWEDNVATTITINNAVNFTEDACVELFNSLPTVAQTVIDSGIVNTVVLNTNVYNSISDITKAIATNKGWTLSSKNATGGIIV